MTRRVSAGPVADIADATCVAVADGEAVVVRVGDSVHSFRNRCLHQDASLEGGWIRDGVLSCPLHFWRYRLADGTHIGTDGSLQRLAIDVVDGEAFVELPDPPQPRPLRDRLLDRARSYDRDRAWHDRVGTDA